MRDSEPSIQAAIAALDELHRADPHSVDNEEGVRVPAELLYAQRMSAVVGALTDAPSPALELAARAQHLCRWEVPRDSYPMTTPGYHAWRRDAAQHHAQRADAALKAAGVSEEVRTRMAEILRTKGRRSDPEAQTLEDAACLVFLEHHLTEFMAKHAHDPDKLLRIISKTWAKMSPSAQERALALELNSEATALVRRALEG